MKRRPFCACGCAARVHRHEGMHLGHCGACGLTACPYYLPVNPELPARFSNTPNHARPRTHDFWWDQPYIETEYYTGPDERRAEWLKWWPEGVRYDVRCLDGGAWDRPTCWGMFATLADAVACARGPVDTDP